MKSFIANNAPEITLPLWNHVLDKEEYEALKAHLHNTPLNELDSRDVTLFYAGWWRHEYDGDAPSKERVFKALGDPRSFRWDTEGFYKLAKQGVIRLGVPWIRTQKQKTYYFRTLLLQGGIPLNHIIHSGYGDQYTRFLKKLIERKPESILDFQYDNEVTRLLPKSSRNEGVYLSCLDVVEAIWSGEEKKYEKIFQTAGNGKGSKIAKELQKYKTEVEQRQKTGVRKRRQFKITWQLDKDSNAIQLIFTSFSRKIHVDDFRELLGVKKEPLQNTYHLLAGEAYAKFERNSAYFRADEAPEPVNWDGEAVRPSITILSDDEEHEYPLTASLTADYPKLEEPSLWTPGGDEHLWHLHKGKSYGKKEKAAVLAPADWQTDQEPTGSLSIAGQDLRWYEFEGTLTFTHTEEEPLTFQTNKPEFDWFVTEEKPKWLHKASMPVVQGKLPSITVLDTEGEKKKPRRKQLRPYKNPIWKKWDKRNLEIGCMEYKIEYEGSEEMGVFFNLGEFLLHTNSRSPETGSIRTFGQDELNFFLKPDEHLEVQRQEDKTKVTLKDLRKSPLRLKASIQRKDQARGLQIELNLPFKGVRILDNKGNVLDPENDTLLLSDFDAKGYTIQTPRVSRTAENQPSYSIQFRNTQNTQIKVRKQLASGSIPLQKHRELVEELFRIADSMSKDTVVELAFCENHPKDDRYDKKLATYTVKNFNQTIDCEGTGSAFVVRPKNPNAPRVGLSLVAIPLDCDPKEIEALPLHESEAQKGSYVLPEGTSERLVNFLVTTFGNEDENLSLLPTFATRNQDNFYEPKEKRLARTQKYLLLEEPDGKYWQRLLRYFKLCDQLDLPFSAFDVCRAATSHPETVARLFCFLAAHSEKPKRFLYRLCPRLQDELGFYFHWAGKTHWDEAKSWLASVYGKDMLLLLDQNIEKLFADNEPKESFEQVKAQVLEGKLIPNPYFSVNQEKQKVRQHLGIRVLNELPRRHAKIPKNYWSVLPVDSEPHKIWALLIAPLAVALSISGKEEPENGKTIWGLDEESVQIRRNIRYAKWLAPEWYASALLFCLYKLQNQ